MNDESTLSKTQYPPQAKKRIRRFNNKCISYFSMLIMNQLTEQKMQTYLLKSNASLIESFIQEMKKLKISDKVLSKIKNLISIQNASPFQRSIPLMMLIMKQIDYFKKFLIINRIDDLTLRYVCNNMNYLHVPKGQYVFHKDEIADNFYGIIFGKIAISRAERKEKKKHKEPKEKEQIVCILESGEYFGDWGLLESKPRYASAFAYEDTDLFFLTRDKFEHTLSKSLRRTNNEQKEFLKVAIPPFIKIGQFDFLFKTITKIFCKKNEIVYREGEIANTIYLIYDGEFSVKKNDSNDDEIKHQFGINLTKTVINLKKGEFVGLETIKNFELNEEGENDQINKYKYETTLISNNDFNILFCLKTEMIKNFYKGEVKEFFTNLYSIRNNIISDFYSKSIGLKQKYQITFRENLLKLQMDQKANLLHTTKESLSSLNAKKDLKLVNRPNLLKVNLSSFNLKLKPKKNVLSVPHSNRIINCMSDRTFATIDTKRNIHTRNKTSLIGNCVYRTLSNYSKENKYDTGTLTLPLVTNILCKRRDVL